MFSRCVAVFSMLFVVVVVVPSQVQAAEYVVRPGDSLTSIARNYGVTVTSLEGANQLPNRDLIRAGQVLAIPGASGPSTAGSSPTSGASISSGYRVRWGDTLSGIALTYGISMATIRVLNPWLGVYPLAGQWLRLCQSCTAGSAVAAPAAGTSGQSYLVQPGDNLTAIAGRYGVSVSGLMAANGLVNANFVPAGHWLQIPAASTGAVSSSSRDLVTGYAQRFGVPVSLALAIGWEESGFNQASLSRTGAIGVMQVEPYTGNTISSMLGRQLNLYNADDNVHAGVYWLSHLLWYYGGNERLAVAAYYQGSKSLADRGMYADTVQYVNNVLSLQQSFGG